MQGYAGAGRLDAGQYAGRDRAVRLTANDLVERDYEGRGSSPFAAYGPETTPREMSLSRG
jgi:hypothetical protein